jgi:putative addiction module killer protein
MSNPDITVLVYRASDGRAPFNDWLLSLKDARTRAKVRARIARLRLGNFGDCKSVGEGVSELRVPYGPGFRVYFARHCRTVVILLCAGDKGTQRQDIALAKRYWRDYENAGKQLS